MNFKNLGNQTAEVGNGRPPGGFHLARQGSIYSLTFDELQNTMGGSIGKDFGSLNMDELLKSIWNAEEVQTTGTNIGVQEPTGDGGANIQRQGSLTLPRTLSQKTVDEVWKDISKEFSGFGQPNLPQRQQTLGEMTLEEFLVKAGVVREEPPQLPSKQNDNGLFPNLTNPQNNSGFGAIGFQQAPARNNNQIAFQPANLPLNVNGVRSNPQQQLFPKQPKLSYGAPMAAIPPSKQMGRNGIVGLSDPAMNGNLVSNGMMGAMVAVGSPAVSSDGIGKTNGDTSSVSPVPYEFSGAMRGRKSGAVEKVVERRQRRMIKNRESAARSRARKQAYTMELEAEVSKLKEQNQELKRKAEMMEMQQNQQVMEMMNTQPEAKRRYIRRTQSGPW